MSARKKIIPKDKREAATQIPEFSKPRERQMGLLQSAVLRWPFSYIRRMDLIQRSNITVSLYVMLPASNSGPTADKKALGLDGFPNKAPNCLLGPGRSGVGFGS